MKKNVLTLDEFIDIDFSLIGINTSMEMYRLIYFINKKLETNFELQEKDVDFEYEDCTAHFPLYYHYSKDLQSNVYIVANKHKAKVNQVNSSGSLFLEDSSFYKTKYLLPELKHVDFLLKVEENEDYISLKKITAQINEIKQVSSTFAIELEQIKSPQNLIFN